MPRLAKQFPEKQCLTCGTRLERKRYSGRLEDFGQFGRRQFCSLSCANSRPKGGTSRHVYHLHARKHRIGECEACGMTNRLHAHHVNEDWTDNRFENIQTLCIFCHQFWHATHRRLGVKPLGRMPRVVPRSSKASPPEWLNCAPLATRSSRKSRPSS